LGTTVASAAAAAAAKKRFKEIGGKYDENSLQTSSSRLFCRHIIQKAGYLVKGNCVVVVVVFFFLLLKKYVAFLLKRILILIFSQLCVITQGYVKSEIYISIFLVPRDSEIYEN
jgi:hypothetical protein